MLNTCQLTSEQTGSKKLPAQYGERLFCARYRYDRQLRKRYKTVELVAEEAEWMPPPKPFATVAIVGVQVEFKEIELHGV